MPLDENRAFKPVNIAILTVSDTRSIDNDTSGDILAERIVAAGHKIADRAILRDDSALIAARLRVWIDDDQIDVVISTGGTGLTGRDVTPEALDRVKTKDIPGFGEMFRWISFASIGTSTIQSRACAVLAADNSGYSGTAQRHASPHSLHSFAHAGRAVVGRATAA